MLIINSLVSRHDPLEKQIKESQETGVLKAPKQKPVEKSTDADDAESQVTYSQSKNFLLFVHNFFVHRKMSLSRKK